LPWEGGEIRKEKHSSAARQVETAQQPQRAGLGREADELDAVAEVEHLDNNLRRTSSRTSVWRHGRLSSPAAPETNGLEMLQLRDLVREVPEVFERHGGELHEALPSKV